MTLAIRNTSSESPVNVRPLAERFGSSSGRRTMTGSNSKRIRKNAPTTNSQMYPAWVKWFERASHCSGAGGVIPHAVIRSGHFRSSP